MGGDALMKLNWPDLEFPPVNQPVLMDALSFQEQQMQSPCVGICEVQEGTCTGCLRTLDEIRDWTTMTQEERDNIMERINASSV